MRKKIIRCSECWRTYSEPMIITRENITDVVMGESRNFRGEENPLMKDITRFKKILEDKIDIPIHVISETLTTAEARRIPQASDEPRSRKPAKKKPVDASAAALILQQYIDKTIKNGG